MFHSSAWLKGLNPEQAEAVCHTKGPLLILAGAGSGKTTVLVSRTGRLIDEEQIPANKICVLTFTNKAARELKHRVSKRLGNRADKIWAGTFHSFGLNILKKFYQEAGLPQQFGVIDQTDSQSLLKEILKDVKVVGKDKFSLDQLSAYIQRYRLGDRFTHLTSDEYANLTLVIAPKYLKRMDLLGVVDFEGLLHKPYQLMLENDDVKMKIQHWFEHVMVDEFQDTNPIQMNLLKKMVEKHYNITVVGDDDQSIYGWRGAEVKNILNFPKEFHGCQVIKLERNYRSQAGILNFANSVISKNSKRHGKTLKSESSLLSELPEHFIFENEDLECEFVAREIEELKRSGLKYRDIAVLYRSNGQGGFLEGTLRRFQIPYKISGGSSIFDRKEAKDVMAFLRQATAPNDLALKRIINLPARGIGETTLERLVQYSKDKEISFYKAAHCWAQAGVSEKIGNSLQDWLDYLKCWSAKLLDLSGNETPGSKLLATLEDIGYKAEVYGSSDSPGAGENKWLVVEVVCRILDHFLKKRQYDFASLKEFVDVMTLRIEDEEEDPHSDHVQLMTFHASKGLEFPVVLLIGLEEDLLPHRTLGENVDEERRLFYVGITRAKQKLLMTRASQRRRHGSLRAVSPSRFIIEISKDLYKEYPHGVRPISGAARASLVQDFLAKLNK